MTYLSIKIALAAGSLLAVAGCTAGNYDLPPCGDTEICGNGRDDDCDGVKDNLDLCHCDAVGRSRLCAPRPGIITQSTNPASACKDEVQLCGIDMQWGACYGSDPVPEQCGNNIDDDCDGSVDKNDPEGCATCFDGQTQSVVTAGLSYRPDSRCKIGRQVCQNGLWTYPPGAEPVGPKASDDTCDNIDDDCDGQLNEDVVWRSGNMSFAMGLPCWEPSKKGACRTVGTVSCSQGAARCSNPVQNPKTDYQLLPANNSYVDASTPYAAWDWDCNGIVESAVCAGSNPSCASGIGKTIYVVFDDMTDCSIAKAGALPPYCNAVIVRATSMNDFVKCGSQLSILECLPGFLPAMCRNGATQTGYLYCR